jgi:hypothetical protein
MFNCYYYSVDWEERFSGKFSSNVNIIFLTHTHLVPFTTIINDHGSEQIRALVE